MSDRDAACVAEVECGAFYGPPLPPISEPGECGFRFTVEMDDPVEPSRWVPCPRCGADVEVEWNVRAEDELRAVADIWRAVWTSASLRSDPHVVTLGRLLTAAGYDMEEVRRVAGTE